MFLDNDDAGYPHEKNCMKSEYNYIWGICAILLQVEN